MTLTKLLSCKENRCSLHTKPMLFAILTICVAWAVVIINLVTL